MAGVCNLAHIWERKKLCHSFGNAVDLLLAVCMLVQEMADMLFHSGILCQWQDFLYKPCMNVSGDAKYCYNDNVFTHPIAIQLRSHLDTQPPSGITCLPLPEQACIWLVTGALPCQNCGKAFPSPLCELGYRFLPWNPEIENLVGAPTGIEPASPAIRASALTTTPQHPGTKCIKFASSNHSWQMVLQHVVITIVFSHCESSTYTVIQALLS